MTDTTDTSNAFSLDTDLDTFSAEFFGKAKPEPTQSEAPVEASEGSDDQQEDADDTSFVEDTDANLEQETSEEDEDESDESGDTVDNEPVEKPKKKTAQERISELTAARREAEREAADLRRQYDELLRIAVASKQKDVEEKPTEPTPATPVTSGSLDPNERLADGTLKYPLGEYDPTFLTDNARLIFREETARLERERQEQQLQSARQQERQAAVETWETKLQEAEANDETADIREVGSKLVETLAFVEPEFGDFLATTIMGMDLGTDVFYYLSTNLDEAQKIAKSDGITATIALGSLQERLRAKKTPVGEAGIPIKQKPRVSTAPTPPKLINKGQSGKFEVDVDTDDLDAFARAFFKKNK